MADKQVNVANVGLGFGAEFKPIYQKHPNANMYANSHRTALDVSAQIYRSLFDTPVFLSSCCTARLRLWLHL